MASPISPRGTSSSTQLLPSRYETSETNTDQKIRQALSYIKMQKNAEKAIIEHQERDPAAPILSNREIESFNVTHQGSSRLVCKSELFERLGTRHEEMHEDMEDVSFFSENEQGILTGVFDGHGGRQVAESSAAQFSNLFFTLLGKSRDIRDAFHSTFARLNKDVLDNESFSEAGATAVVSFIDKSLSHIFTATLGDSEAFIFRKTDEKSSLKAIPLSCVRDWTSGKDAVRLHLTMPNARIDYEYPKNTRVPFPQGGINVSRTIGDKIFRDTFEAYLSDKTKEIPNPLSSKPKVTAQRVYPGDIVVIGSDGLTDSLRVSIMAEEIQNFTPASGQTLAATLGKLASTRIDDDITVRAVYISSDKSA